MHEFNRKTRGKLYMNWIRAYLECLNDGREAELLTYLRPKQLDLFY
jgi:hypothetical protein